MSRYIILILLFISSFSFGQTEGDIPTAPDYTQLTYWAAHPGKHSSALSVPKNGYIAPRLMDVDIFFIHPTSYTKEKTTWNASLSNSALNEFTDSYVIKNQASIFNQVGEIYAPRYRQAHITAYGLEDYDQMKEIFDVAYADVLDAFQYYWDNHNNGRPFIIASHSQGTTHSKRLLEEVIDNNAQMRSQMVVGYLVGMDVRVDQFKNISVCEKEKETGCFVSWRTINENASPPSYYPSGNEYAVVNPVTWNIKESKSVRKQHEGAVLRNFNKIHRKAVAAHTKEGILYIGRPKVPFSFLVKIDNYHIADYNMFYYDVQYNAIRRTKAFTQSITMR